MVNGGQRPDFGGQRLDGLQIYILGISIPNARCMQNLGSIRPLGAILGLPSHIKVEVAVPLLSKSQDLVFYYTYSISFCIPILRTYESGCQEPTIIQLRENLLETSQGIKVKGWFMKRLRFRYGTARNA